MHKKFTREELHTAMVTTLKGNMATVEATIRFVVPLVGGQPANDKGLEAFVKHHLKLTGDEADKAVARIKKEEITATPENVTPVEGEVQEEKTYGLNCLRRTSTDVACVGSWMVRAMVKQVASRLGLFAAKGKMGSKGDLSEGMLVVPSGPSLVGTGQEIGIIVDGKPYTDHSYKKFMGSVSSAKGKVSIVHDSEIAPVGAEIHFTLEYPSTRIKTRDIAAIFGMAERVGLGSVRSMEFGRFEVVKLEVNTPDMQIEDEEEEAAPKGKKKGKKKDEDPEAGAGVAA